MAEQLTPHLDSSPEKRETLDLSEQSVENLRKIREEAEKIRAEQPEQVEQYQQAAKEKAISGQEITIGERESAPASHSFGAHKALKAQSYKQTLANVQKHLKTPEKGLSKLIHKPSVERASSLASQTVGRPTGLAFGALCAFLVSAFALLTAKHYGFQYNFSLVLLVFVAGYLVASVFELLAKVVKRR